MSDSERERVNAAFEHGVDSFSQDDLEAVIKDGEKAEKKSINLGAQYEDFKLLWGLLRDYRNGTYRNVPWRLIASIGFAVMYLVVPLDVIPDYIPVAGFIDDATVFAFVVKAFKAEIDTYRRWKAVHATGKQNLNAQKTL